MHTHIFYSYNTIIARCSHGTTKASHVYHMLSPTWLCSPRPVRTRPTRRPAPYLATRPSLAYCTTVSSLLDPWPSPIPESPPTKPLSPPTDDPATPPAAAARVFDSFTLTPDGTIIAHQLPGRSTPKPETDPGWEERAPGKGTCSARGTQARQRGAA